MIQTESLTLGYRDNVIINHLNIEIPKGKITIFVGANGCGKSTLLRSLARLLKPMAGTVRLAEDELQQLSTKTIAKKLAVLPQSASSPEGITVQQLVKQGRYPHQSLLQQWSVEDEQVVNEAMASTGVKHLADRTIASLSGGQRQRAWIAMTLAQRTEILLLDEPTTFLDVAHQIEILDLCHTLNEMEGKTVVIVLHDLNLAARYADHMIALKDQTVYAEGKPEQVVTPEMMRAVFFLECEVIPDPVTGTPMTIPYGKKAIRRNDVRTLAR
ncbi:ABC-type Fe3+-siderophore transport system, ATPase component [Geomicrobium sp. JCM 19037]|uniref:ABC transporter ATP-binding protein n=1 Tax=Geomicrobium sp. JCM 19037 TaxID=1460634 RepID=UPI00045F29C8|nr:ABC transporter ATP-binding protein [Geomicrobium sp. JCM 19037]GAK02113.1 ABC-type Fe3+-siderophore transport system, ATPase component [Geomicrobium sp. JCM 19037]